MGRVELVRRLLNPENIAIVGATPRGGWSEVAYQNLRRFGYPGRIYLVNPRYSQLWGEPCYPTIQGIPDRVDHVLVVVPARAALSIVHDAVRAAARSVTILAGGFGEGGDPEGLSLATELDAIVGQSGIALCGPNCMGALAAPSRAVTLADRTIDRVESGPVAIVGQSGGVVLFLEGSLRHRGVGVRYAVSSGNEVGLSTADYVRFFAEDPGVRVIAAFIEGIKDLPRFLESCDEAKEKGKPVVVVKVGGSEAGREAAVSHTGAVAGKVAAFDAVMQGRGVARVEGLTDLVEFVEFASHARAPAGPGVGVISYSGGLRGVLLDSAERVGFRFPSLSQETEAKLKATLPVGTAVGNPLDCGWGGLSSPETYFECVDLLLADPNIDVLLAQERLPRAPGETRTESYIAGLQERAAKPRCKPIAVFSMLPDSVNDYGLKVRQNALNLPFLQGAEEALTTVRAASAWGMDKLGNSESLVLSGHQERRQNLVSSRAASEVEATNLLTTYGIPTVGGEVVTGPEEAVEVAERSGFPVVAKGIGRGVAHKSELGLVRTHLQGAEQVSTAIQDIGRAAEERGLELEGYLIGPHVNDGFELALGVEVDSEVGPVVTVGWGGMMMELLGDVAVARAPITEKDAEQVLGKTRAGQVLAGYRGGTEYDVDAVKRALIALGHLASEEAERLAELDVNPFRVWEKGQGALALDALAVWREDGTVLDPCKNHK